MGSSPIIGTITGCRVTTTHKDELRRISYEAFKQDTAPINIDPTKLKTLSDKVGNLCAKREIALGL